jgi:hypothetical protein
MLEDIAKQQDLPERTLALLKEYRNNSWLSPANRLNYPYDPQEKQILRDCLPWSIRV